MAKDQFTKTWITTTAIPIVESYGGNMTIRSLHYRLVAAGMHNTQQHYKRVVNAMIDARKEGLLPYDSFMDHERESIGVTEMEPTNIVDAVSDSKRSIQYWLDHYYKNRWENQPYYPEVFIEKKALQGVFEEPCDNMDIALNPCKGYPSLTFLYNASKRFQNAIDYDKKPIILYFGDYDPSGEDIPRSIKDNLLNDFHIDVEVRRIALMEHQVVEWKLPPAPKKDTDSRSNQWDGLGQVELDAVEPKQIVKLLNDAIDEVFDIELYDKLLAQQREEAIEYRIQLKELFNQ